MIEVVPIAQAEFTSLKGICQDCISQDKAVPLQGNKNIPV